MNVVTGLDLPVNLRGHAALRTAIGKNDIGRSMLHSLRTARYANVRPTTKSLPPESPRPPISRDGQPTATAHGVRGATRAPKRELAGSPNAAAFPRPRLPGAASPGSCLAAHHRPAAARGRPRASGPHHAAPPRAVHAKPPGPRGRRPRWVRAGRQGATVTGASR